MTAVSGWPRAAGSGLDHTQPALDLDALIGGFRPLFKALDPDKVNRIASSIITVFQGQGATINDILDQTASLTATLADRDQAIGEIITNLNTVLATTVKHEKEFDGTVDKLEVADHRTEEQGRSVGRGRGPYQQRGGNTGRPAGRGPAVAAQHLRTSRGHPAAADTTICRLSTTRYWRKLPDAYRIIGRSGGIYGDFFNFYLCDLSLKLNGLQPGGPVRTVKLFVQPTGRCTPQ